MSSFPHKLWDIIRGYAVDPHTRVHRGHMYHCSTISTSLANNASLDMIMVPAAGDYPHMLVEAAAGGDAELLLCEGCTYTGGAADPVYNQKRSSSAVWSGQLLLGATVLDVGTQLTGQLLPGGRRNQASGSGADFNLEWVLRAQVAYLIRLTNRSGGAVRASVGCSHYTAPLIADA